LGRWSVFFPQRQKKKPKPPFPDNTFPSTEGFSCPEAKDPPSGGRRTKAKIPVLPLIFFLRSVFPAVGIKRSAEGKKERPFSTPEEWPGY